MTETPRKPFHCEMRNPENPMFCVIDDELCDCPQDVKGCIQKKTSLAEMPDIELSTTTFVHAPRRVLKTFDPNAVNVRESIHPKDPDHMVEGCGKTVAEIRAGLPHLKHEKK